MENRRFAKGDSQQPGQRPSKVPVFKHQPRADIQWRVALLYFVRDWSGEEIAKRYGIGKTRVQQLIRHWSARAIALGLLDRIPSEESVSPRASLSCPPHGQLDEAAL